MTGQRPSHRIKRRSLAIGAVIALAMTVVPLVLSNMQPASAEFGAGEAPRYSRNINGDFMLIGNTVFDCGSSTSACENSSYVNDQLNMSNVDPDGNGPLFNGSSGSITIPSGSVVDAAYLYWGGNFGAKNKNNNSYYCNPSQNSVSLATADKSQANKVQLAVGASGYTPVTADEVYTHPAGGLNQTPTTSSSDPGRNGLTYEGVSDVTAQFASVNAATATTVKVANIQAAQGNNCYAGWALAVVYRFPAANCLEAANNGANLRDDYRNVSIYDDLLQQLNGAADSTTKLSGFITTGTSAETTALRLGAVAWEGDEGISGDSLKIKASSQSGSGTKVDPAGPSGTNNFFDSGKQISADHNADMDVDPDSGAVIERGFVNGRGDGHGIDAKTQGISVPGGTTSLDVTFTTTGDLYYPGAFALSSPIKCLLGMEKDQAVNGTAVARDNATTPNPPLSSGDELTFTVPVRAIGDVDLTNVVLTDAIPPGTTYVANSAKWGTGRTAAAAATRPNNASFSSNTVSASIGTLNNLNNSGSCASNETCFASLQFRVTVDAGLTGGTLIRNQADATFGASGVSGIHENSNEVTDKVGPRLTVSKNIVDPQPGDPTTFNFDVVCNATPANGSPFSLANGATKVLAVNPGSTCSVTETTNSNFATIVTGATSTNGGSIVMDADKAVTFTNTRQFGSIKVDKTVVAIAGDPIAAPTFDFQVDCTGVAGYPRSLQIGGSGGSASTPADIPYGSSCVVTESGSPLYSASPTVTIANVDRNVHTAEFTNTRRSGSLKINKTSSPDDGTFDFSVDCDGTAFDQSISVTTAAGVGSSTISALPSGINCAVTESPSVGWTITTAATQDVTVPPGAVAAVAFSNVRPTKDLVITKAISGTYATPVSGDFDFSIDCGPIGTFEANVSATSDASNSATVSGIPLGSQCTVTEAALAGWSLDESVAGNTNDRAVTIGDTNEVTFTNRHDVGELTLRKTIDQGSGTFDFSVVCNGTEAAGSPFSVTVAAPETSASATVSNVPTGSSCVITESADTASAQHFEQVTPANSAPVTVESTTAADTADFVNRRLTGTLVVAKEFPADSLGDPAREFTFSWDCGPEPRSVTLTAGQSHRVEGLPTDTQCNVTETADDQYTSTVAPDDGSTTIAEGDNIVAFTNRRKAGTLELTKSLLPASDSGRFDLTVDGQVRAAAVGDDGTTGVLDVVAGSYVIGEAVADGTDVDMADYDSTLVCNDATGPVAVGTDGSVVVDDGAAVRCVVTNGRKPVISVSKNLVPATDAGEFQLVLDDTPVAVGGDGTTSGAITVGLGDHLVSENAGNESTDLANYVGAIECFRPDGSSTPSGALTGDWAAQYGSDYRCVITNTRRPADLTITKTPINPETSPGGTAEFRVTVTNAADAATAKDVVVSDPLPAGVTYLSSTDDVCGEDGTTCALGTLAAGASVSFDIRYRVDSDTTLTTVHNVVTVTSPDDPESPPAEADVLIGQITVVKDATQEYFTAVGQTLDYTYTVHNAGLTTLTQVTIADNKIPTAAIDCGDGTATIASMAADATVVCSGSYVVGADDIAAERVDNIVTVSSSELPDVSDDESVPFAGLGIDKTITSDGPYEAGDTIDYQIVVTNHGAIALHDVTVSDPAAQFDQSVDCDPVAPLTELAIDASITCTATHEVTQPEFDAGSFTNTATADSTETPPVNDQVTSTFDQTPTLEFTKTVTSEGPYVLGDTVEYRLTATNGGNTTLKGVRITESDGATVTSCTPSGGGEDPGDTGVSLAPGTTLVCDATHEITQGDVDDGFHDNTATADSDQTDPIDADATVPVAQAPALKLTKKVADSPEPPDEYAFGDTVHYEIVATNTGTVTLTGVRVTDAGIGAVLGDCAPEIPATLAPDATVTCAATHVVTQADVDDGTYSNLATATSNETPPATDDEIVEIGQNPDIELTKSVTSAGPYRLDDVVEFRLVAKNTGDMTLTNVVIAEQTADAVLGDCAPEIPATLAPDATVTCAATHVVTQGDIDAGEYVNKATADADQTDPRDDEVEVDIDQTPELTLTKTVTSSSPYVLGDTVTYSLVATNTGDTTLTNVQISESEGATLGECTPSASGAELAPGASLTCAASYEVAQGDVDAGTHDNTATATSDQTDPVDADADVPIYQDPALDITKSIATDPTPPGEYDKGDTIHYVVEVTNTGTVTLHDVTVTDPNADGFDAGSDCSPPSPAATLTVGAKITCTAEHEVTQGDLDAGTFTNTATADSDETPPESSSVVTAFEQTSLLSLDKVVTSAGPYVLDSVVTYDLVATNDGNTTLTNVAVTESNGATITGCTPDGDAVSLEPTQQLTCTASYTIVQSDVDAGEHTNTATADSDQTDPTDDDATVTTARDPRLGVTKSVTSDGPYDVGDLVTFSITATNTGNTTLTGVTIEELTADAQLGACAPTLPATLALGASVTCAATHVVTQGDLDRGDYLNVARADSDQTPSTDADATVEFIQTPAMDIDKVVTSDGPYDKDDTVEYSITVTNTGNVTLHGVTITESDGAELGDCTPAIGDDGVTLAPDDTVVCTATHEVTQGDVDAGTHINTATADSDETPPVDGSATVPVVQTPALGLVKTVTSDGPYELGDDIEFSIVATNTGNMTLTNVTVAEVSTDAQLTGCTPSVPASLAPSETVTCTATHEVTQPDLDSGNYTNVATASSTQTPPEEASAEVPLEQTPQLEIVKSIASEPAPPADGYEVGDTIHYSVVATNNGNITLTNVAVSDTTADNFDPAVDCDPASPAPSLAVDASIACTAAHVVTQTDVDAGTFTNTATADSDQTDPVEDDVVTAFDQTPLLAIDKTVTSEGPYVLGDTVEYSIVVTNTGRITLDAVTVSESKGATLGDCTPALGDDGVELAPTETITCTATHEVTQDDVDSGTHTNTATADSEQTDPVDDSAEVPVAQTPGLSIDKSVTSKGPYEVGDEVEYSIVATNSGTVTLTEVEVTDPTDGVDLGDCDPATPATLAPDATVTCTATHEVTQADLDKGTFANTATADSEQTDPVEDDAVVEFEQRPAMTIDKKVTSDGPYVLGDIVEYSIVATNTGNITLDDVEVTESEGATLGECDPTTGENGVSLAPGEKLTCSATHEVTQDDVDAGMHTNTATADSEQTDPVEDDAEVEVEQDPSLEVTKTVTSQGPYALGDPIRFEVVATNTGTTTLTDVNVAEVNDDATLSECDPAIPTILALDAQIRCVATHLVTQADFDAGEYRNVVLAESEQTDPVEDDETVPTPDPAADLAITKSLVGSLVTGKSASYDLAVSNKGPATATGVVVLDSVPAGLRPTAATGDGWTCTIAGNDVRCSTATAVAAGEDLEPISITVDVLASGSESVTNTGTVSGDQPDPDPSNNSDTITSPITEVEGNNVVPAPTPDTRPTNEVKGIARLAKLAWTGNGLLLLFVGLGLLGAGLFFVLSSRRRHSDD